MEEARWEGASREGMKEERNGGRQQREQDVQMRTVGGYFWSLAGVAQWRLVTPLRGPGKEDK